DGLDAQVGPIRLLHREPVSVRLETPLEHEARLVLLARDQTDDVLVQPGRHSIGFDVGDEPVAVLLLDECFERRIGLWIAGHRVSLTHSCGMRLMRVSGTVVVVTVRFAPESSASEMSVSARRIAALTRCHACPTLQLASSPHALCSLLHSVIANGPSSAPRIGAAVIPSGARAS